MDFVKMHGLGNDFVILEGRAEDVDREETGRLAVALCDRHFGVGADGLVLMGPDPELDLFMRIFNPDGSEPEMCGNAIRCVAAYAWARGLVKRRQLTVRTLAGPRPVWLRLASGRVAAVRVDMGEPVLERSLIPMLGPPGMVRGEELDTPLGTVRVTAVSMGNPHCVVFVDDFDRFPLRQWGPLLEVHPLFPGKTNVEFAKIEARDRVTMRVWERGAGETLACGTGACATLVAAHLNGLVDRAATLHLAGGDLDIEWDPTSNRVFMSGPATMVFSGHIEPDDLSVMMERGGCNQ
ncbi:MAG: diaminopimelate epimerase [Syntrophomonadaceae bacterium]|nr:diaminopimelate epimerase [Syntrophomonadaceae bacterium]MDH7496872.1 diaminopimelate epimerase [Syntrophomonadaceae bacterium]